MGFRPTDLGHAKVRSVRTERQRRLTGISRVYADFIGIRSLCPRTFDVLDVDDATSLGDNRYSVEPIGTRFESTPIDPQVCRDRNRPPLLPSDGLEGMTEAGTAAPLHFHERDESVSLDHEIDLLAHEADVPIHDVVAACGQECLGNFFVLSAAVHGAQGGIPCLEGDLSSLQDGVESRAKPWLQGARGWLPCT